MKVLSCVVRVMLVVALSSCGVEISTESSTVNGKSAGDYYGQFDYREISERPGTYQYLVSNNVTFAKDASQREVSYSVDLFLLSSGRYRALYQEWTTMNGWKVQSHRETFEGAREFNGTTLVLSGLGSASGVVVNGAEMVSLSLAKDLHTPGAALKSVMLSKLVSTESMEQRTRPLLRGDFSLDSMR